MVQVAHQNMANKTFLQKIYSRYPQISAERNLSTIITNRLCGLIVIKPKRSMKLLAPQGRRFYVCTSLIKTAEQTRIAVMSRSNMGEVSFPLTEEQVLNF